MATNSISDWVVKVGFDDSDVTKGAARVEKTMSKIDRVTSKTTTRRTAALSKQNEVLQKQNRLEAQKLALRKKIAQAEAIGIKDLKKERGALGGSNPLRIRSQVLALDKRITIERKKQRDIEASRPKPVKTAPVKAGPKPFALDETGKLRTANTIDSVVRRAERGLGATSDEFRRIEARAERLKQKIGEVDSKAGLERLRNSIRLLREDTTVTTQRVRALNNQLKKQQFISNAAQTSVRNLARSYVSVYAAIESGRYLMQVGKDFENMNATLLLTGGSAEQAAKDFEFLKGLAREVGVSVRETSKSFSKFAVAGRSAGLTDGEMKTAFEDMAVTIRATGLSQDKANLSFLAMQQMLSNGVVSMQELKLQLSEQLPQTMAVAEKALRNLGHTSGSVKDIISTGTVESGTFVKEMTRLMAEQAKESGSYEMSLKSMTAAQARFFTELELSMKSVFDAGGNKGVVKLFESLGWFVKDLIPLFKLLGRAIDVFGSAVGTTVGTVGSLIGSFFNVLKIIGKVISEVLGLADAVTETDGKLLDLGTGGEIYFRGWNTELDEVSIRLKLLGNEIELLAAKLERLLAITSEEIKFTLNPSDALDNYKNVFSKFGNEMAAVEAKFGTAATKNVSSNKTTVISGAKVEVNVQDGDPMKIRTVLDDWLQDVQAGSY